jgi:hypothetical protein
MNSLTHEPIARALVEAQGDGTLTDGNGRFELNLAAGSIVSLTARRPGYVAGNANHVVHVQEGLPDLSFFLTPQAVIAGHISTSSGADADGTRVTAYRRRTRGGQQWWEAQGAAVADSAGRFRLSNMQTPAEYLLMTGLSADRDQRVNANSSTYGFPAVFYPDGGETSATGLLSLAPGQQANVEMAITRQPFYPVTIQTKNDTGTAQLQVIVHDETGLEGDIPAQWNAEKRTAEVALPNGHYFAELRSFDRKPAYGRIEFMVAGGPVMGLRVVVLPLHAIPVEIHKEFAAGNENNPSTSVNGPNPLRFEIHGRYASPGVNISLISADGPSGQIGGLVPVPGASDPTLFELEGITPGRYWVRTGAIEGYVSSITSGGVDLSRDALTIGPGNTTPPLQVTLRDDGGTIHCTAQHSASAYGAAADPGIVPIFAIPIAPTTGQTLQNAIGPNNDATLTNVPPGTYSVIALDQFVDIDSLDQAVLNSYSSKGQTVTVEAQGSANVTLDVLHVSDSGTAVEVAQ